MKNIQNEIITLIKSGCNQRNEIISRYDNKWEVQQVLSNLLMRGKITLKLGIYSISKNPSKYKNKKVEIDGHLFDSTSEGERYLDLKILEQAGKITDLILQPPFKYYEDDKFIFTYKADFGYTQDGDRIIEDVKSVYTAKIPLFRLKKKLIEAKFKIKITEVMC